MRNIQSILLSLTGAAYNLEKHKGVSIHIPNGEQQANS